MEECNCNACKKATELMSSVTWMQKHYESTGADIPCDVRADISSKLRMCTHLREYHCVRRIK